MVYEIEWSKRAINDFEAIIDYLLVKWSENVAKDFASKIENILFVLEKTPLLYPGIPNKTSVRKCVIGKQNVLYYQISGKKITLLTIFDGRQHPAKLKL